MKSSSRSVAVCIAKKASLDSCLRVTIDPKKRFTIVNALGAIADFSGMKFKTAMADEETMIVTRVK